MSENNGTTAVHLVLQGKGGVGKSLVASILAQYFAHRLGLLTHCVDTDPVNQTFTQYRDLQVQRLELLAEGSIDSRLFDGLMERMLTEYGVFVVDNGSSTFIPVWNYMLENGVPAVLAENGRKLFVHCVVTGGQALTDTLTGFAKLAETSPERNIVLWMNEYFGRIERDGRVLSELPVYQRAAAKVWGSVVLPRRNRETFGRDLEELLRQKRTFREAQEGNGLPVMVKRRLGIVRDELFLQLDRLHLA